MAAFIDARLDDGEQNVCLMVSQRENGASLIDWSCTPRADFTREGITTELKPSESPDADEARPQTLTWGADDSLMIESVPPTE
ncbi:hypothetical protein P2A57_24215 [Xanthomonas perforans]